MLPRLMWGTKRTVGNVGYKGVQRGTKGQSGGTKGVQRAPTCNGWPSCALLMLPHRT